MVFPAFLQGSTCKVPYAGLRFKEIYNSFLCVLCASVVNKLLKFLKSAKTHRQYLNQLFSQV